MSSLIRILHVDDGPEFRDLTATVLERDSEQFTVDLATDAHEGLDMLAADEYDCIVSDYEMPRMNGLDFLTAVREEYSDLPFILFTGKGSEEVASDAISAGVTDYLRKGSGIDQYELLANRITNAVSQVRAEQQLDEERQRFQILFDRLSQATVEVEYHDDKPIVERVNPAFEETFGYDADDIVGNSLDAYIVPEDRADEATTINQRVQGGASLDSEEITRQTADGLRRFLLQNAVYDDGSGGFAIYTDITERKEWERELERQNTRLRALFEHFPEPTIAYTYQNGDPYIADINEAFVETFGYDKETALGTHVDELVVPPDRRDQAQRIDERVKAGELIDETLRRQTADGLGEFRFRNIRLPDDENIDGYAVYEDITAYRDRERELERQNDLFRKAQDIATVGAWEYDVEADAMIWTDQVYDIHGVSTDFTPSPEKGLEFYHPDDRATIRNAFERAVEEGEPYDIEARFVTADDEHRWVRTRGDPQMENGAVVRVRGTIQDITEEKRREQRLEETTARLEALFDQSPDIINIHDAEGRIVESNARLTEKTGYEQSEVSGMHIWDLNPAADPEKAMALWESMAPGDHKRVEGVYQHRDGSTFPVDIHVRRLNREDEPRFMSINRDITDRKQRRQELIELERAVETLCENVPIIFYTFDEDGVFTRSQGKALDRIGFKPGEAVGQSVFDLYADRPNIIEHCERALDREHVSATVEIGDGIFEADYAPVRDDGEIVGVTGHKFDITEYKKREERLRRQNERLDQFASVVSHDLRNPLNVASARLELVAEDCDSPHLADVSAAHDKMERLIEDLLTFAQAGSEALNSTTVSLPDLIRDCWERFAETNAYLDIETERAIRADRDRVKQLFKNLLANAVDHGGSDVTVHVGTLSEGFYVEDDGPGIPEEEREDVFTAGYSTSQDGTGFGLGIVEQVVEAHGWDIRVTDGSSGGARFEIIGIEFAE